MNVKVEKRIGDIEASLKLLANYMKEEHSRLEALAKKGGGSEEIEELKKKIAERESAPHEESMTTDMEKKLQSEVSRLEGLIYSIPREKALKEYSESMKVAEELKKSVDLRLQVVEGKLKNTAQDIISSKLQDFETLQDRFKRLDGRVSDAVSILENMKASHDDSSAKKFEKRIKEGMEEMQEQLRKENRSDSREYKKLADALDDMENRMKHFQRKEDLSRTLSEIKGRFEDFEAKLKRNDTRDFATKKELEEAIGDIGEYKKAGKSVQDEIKAIVQKEAADINNLTDLKKMTDEMMTLSQRLAEMESTFERRLTSVENRNDDEQDVMDVRSDVDDIDKRLVEMEMSIKDLKSIEAQSRKALEHLENFDRDMKMESTKFVTAQLSEFAKHVDSRLPAVVTRDEFSQSMIELNHKISTLETPDMTHLNKRMRALEGKVSEIYYLLKSFSDSLPVVVE
ncbi:MAG: hypothetical protein HYT73_02940 [Candidatus Aenigmarchaeota archaeon]|nr:hypothetical protein [Candidatus Aenigmarchaeota archaeon]